LPPDFSGIPTIGNAGLWYDKFCNQWEPGWKRGLGSEGKVEWIKAFSGKAIGDPKLLEEAIERRMMLLERCGGLAVPFKTQGPMVSGLGRSHPVENGFAWHHILGVPYLPGSSIKGMVRSYATCWLDGPEKVEEADLMRIFGPRKNSIQVGSVIFTDALPILPVKLKAEVMTPHYAPYYAGSDEAPGDWHKPIPIPFLAVDEGQEFLFGVLPRTPADKADCNRASKWLCKALDVMGAGAKTSSGYGRFSEGELKNIGMLQLALLFKSDNSVTDFLIDSPDVSLRKWSGIEDPAVKCEAAKEMKRLYQEKGEWIRPRNSIRRVKNELENYLETKCSSLEDAR
jgi:CRISPR-associated protein Cmr6